MSHWSSTGSGLSCIGTVRHFRRRRGFTAKIIGNEGGAGGLGTLGECKAWVELNDDCHGFNWAFHLKRGKAVNLRGGTASGNHRLGEGWLITGPRDGMRGGRGPRPSRGAL